MSSIPERDIKENLARERILRTFLTSEARQRLTNVRIVRPEVARLVEDYVIQLASTGKLKRQLTDGEIKQILAKIAESRREVRIRW